MAHATKHQNKMNVGTMSSSISRRHVVAPHPMNENHTHNGINADFSIVGVVGLGLEEDKRKIQDAVETHPDVVFVGICPTRLFLICHDEFRHRGKYSLCLEFLLFLLWKRVSDRIPVLCGYPDIPPSSMNCLIFEFCPISV
jgi:hypothetical protein